MSFNKAELALKIRNLLRHWRDSTVSDTSNKRLNDYLRNTVMKLEDKNGKYRFSVNQKQYLRNILEQFDIDVTNCF